MNKAYLLLIRKKWHIILLFFLIIIGFFLRFYNYPYRYSLGEETVRDAVIGIQGARDFQLPLTGSFSSLGPFTFGPWYAYQLIIFAFVVPSVYSPWIYLGIIAVLYIFVMYKIGELLFGKEFGLLLAFFATFSPAQVISATHLTSHNMTNICAALIILIFLMLVRKNLSYWWSLILGFLIGVGINLHLQMIGLGILLLLLLIYKPKKYLYFITGCIGVFISFLPFLFFETNNHWFNTRNIIYYIFYGKNAIYVPNRWLFYVRDFWPAFWGDVLGIPAGIAAIIIVLFIVTIIWAIYKKKLSTSMILLLVAFSFLFILLRYYWGPRFFGYLNFFRPFIYIFTGYTLFTFTKIKYGKYFLIALLGCYIFLVFPRNYDQLQKDSFTMQMYSVINTLEEKYPNDKFTIFTCMEKYKGSYNSSIYSLMLILESKNKLSEKGRKIGMRSDCQVPEEKKDEQYVFADSEVLQQNAMLNFSSLSEKSLLKFGWKKLTFRRVYDQYARWWFELQP